MVEVVVELKLKVGGLDTLPFTDDKFRGSDIGLSRPFDYVTQN